MLRGSRERTGVSRMKILDLPDIVEYILDSWKNELVANIGQSKVPTMILSFLLNPICLNSMSDDE